MSLAIVLCNLQTHQRTIMDTEIGEELPASFHPSDAGEIGMHDMHGGLASDDASSQISDPRLHYTNFMK